MTRSRSGQRLKVDQARAVVAQTIGDAARRDRLQVGIFVATAKPGERVEVKMEAISVLTISEAATRLGITTDEMQTMAERGTVKSLKAGWMVVIPTNEVERLKG